MTAFADASGKSWLVEFDGLLLQDVLTETGIDLGDLSAGGLDAIEQSPIKLVRVLIVLCREQWREAKFTERQFSKLLRGDVLSESLAAVLGAAAVFFPPSQWSEVQSALESQREFRVMWAKIQPVLRKLNEPEMESLRPAILEALTEMMGGMDSQKLAALTSATGSVAIPPLDASGSPGNVESAQKD